MPSGRSGGSSILLDDPEANIGMQFLVQTAELLPCTLELAGKLLVRHVITGTPESTGVGDAELARALVGEFDETGVFGPHRGGNRVPAGPQVEEFLGVARRCHSNVEIIDAEALPGIPSHAVLAFAVHASELSRELGGFDSECQVGRSGPRVTAKKHHFTRQIGLGA